MKKINRYQYSYLTKDGTGTREVRARTRIEAARLLKCPIEEVEFLETVQKTLLERRGDHAARTPISQWDLDRIQDSSTRPFRSHRPKKKVAPKEKAGRRK